MQSLLIVDDQKIVREGICALLGELGLKFSQIYQASCSAKAIEIIDRCRPDLILLDIVMTGEDGFSVVCHIRSNNLTPGIIIITSYDEFDYAVRALKYNVNDFLLKPIKKVELYQAIFNAGQPKAGSRQEDRLYYYILLNCYMEGKSVDIDINQLFIHTGLKSLTDQPLAVLCVQLVTDGSIQPAFDTLTAGLIKAGLREIHYPKSETEYVYILSFPPDLDRLYELTNAILTGNGVYALGVSETGDLRDLRKLYREARTAGEFAQINDLFNIPVQFDERQMVRQIVVSVEENLIDSLQRGDDTGSAEIIDELFNRLSLLEERIAIISEEATNAIRRIDQRLTPEIEQSADSYLSGNGSSLLRLKSEVMVHLRRLSEHLKHPGHIPPQIRKMIAYVEAHYSKDLSLALVANQFNLNYSYACNLFSRFAGMSFADYLNHLRLEKAADLLRYSAMRVYDIAGKVGFSSEKYFFKKFKELYQMTPVEYRNQHASL